MACSINSLTFSSPEANPTMYITPHMTTATMRMATSNIDIVFFYRVIDMESGETRAILHDPHMARLIAEDLCNALGRTFMVEADVYNLDGFYSN